MNDTTTRLLINPITKTIIPKYRHQKAVYVAKGDHNSVQIIFELPRYVNGYDMSDEKNLIHIHFVNLSEDGENYSKGVAEAISREIEDDKLSFAWLVDDRATKYAGVVSVGISVKQYDDIDGQVQKKYSWSTTPYGKTVVWDSHDNTAEAVEREYDYLVATVNTLVTLSLQNKLSEAEMNIDNKVAQAQSQLVSHTTSAIIEFDRKASGAIDNFDRNANEALELINNSVAETKKNAQDADDRAHLARDRVELAKSWAVGDTGYREGENTNNAKYYSEETSKQVKLAQQTVEEAQQTVEEAQRTVEEAQRLRDDVQTYPPIAERHARTAESWARGGTGIREGEDTDNAKYYSEQIGNSANEAKEYAEQAAEEAKNANVTKSAVEQIAEQTCSYVGEARQYAEEAQFHARDSGVANMTAGEYAEESRNSANEAKGYAEQAQNAVVGINTPYANALKGSASGEMVSIKDISPLEHKINVELSSKNLIPYPYANTTKTESGITFTINDDGTITIDGTSTANIKFNLTNEFEFKIPKGSYVISGGATSCSLVLRTTNSQFIDVVGSAKSFTIVDNEEIRDIYLYITAGKTFSNVVIRPLLGKDTTVYTPYVDVSKAKLYKTGKNLISYPYVHTTRTENGITFTDNGDGTVTANGTATANTLFSVANWGKCNLPAGSYFLSGCPVGGSSKYRITIALKGDITGNASPIFEGSDNGNGLQININETAVGLYLRLVIMQGTTANNLVFKPQLEKDTGTEYESYIEPVEVDKDNVTSLYPTTTLYSDTSGVLIEAEYNRDLNKVIAEIYNAIANL